MRQRRWGIAVLAVLVVIAAFVAGYHYNGSLEAEAAAVPAQPVNLPQASLTDNCSCSGTNLGFAGLAVCTCGATTCGVVFQQASPSAPQISCVK